MFTQGMASYLWDASSFTKYGFKLMMNVLDTQMFVKTSINNCLWNLTDPLVQKAKSMMPGLVPEENMGILYQVNNWFFLVCFFFHNNNCHKSLIIDYGLTKQWNLYELIGVTQASRHVFRVYKLGGQILLSSSFNQTIFFLVFLFYDYLLKYWHSSSIHLNCVAKRWRQIYPYNKLPWGHPNILF